MDQSRLATHFLRLSFIMGGPPPPKFRPRPRWDTDAGEYRSWNGLHLTDADLDLYPDIGHRNRFVNPNAPPPTSSSLRPSLAPEGMQLSHVDEYQDEEEDNGQRLEDWVPGATPTAGHDTRPSQHLSTSNSRAATPEWLRDLPSPETALSNRNQGASQIDHLGIPDGWGRLPGKQPRRRLPRSPSPISVQSSPLLGGSPIEFDDNSQASAPTSSPIPLRAVQDEEGVEEEASQFPIQPLRDSQRSRHLPVSISRIVPLPESPQLLGSPADSLQPASVSQSRVVASPLPFVRRRPLATRRIALDSASEDEEESATQTHVNLREPSPSPEPLPVKRRRFYTTIGHRQAIRFAKPGEFTPAPTRPKDLALIAAARVMEARSASLSEPQLSDSPEGSGTQNSLNMYSPGFALMLADSRETPPPLYLHSPQHSLSPVPISAGGGETLEPLGAYMRRHY